MLISSLVQSDLGFEDLALAKVSAALDTVIGIGLNPLAVDVTVEPKARKAFGVHGEKSFNRHCINVED